MRAIARRAAIRVAIVLAVVLGTASRAAAVEPGWAEGQWIGGFEGVDGTVYVSAQVEAEAGALTGSLELPLQGDGAVRLEQVKATADSLHFDVRGSKTRLAFEGRRRAPGRVTGTVRQGRGAASFELLKVATLPPARLDAIAGTYELEPGHNVLIARSQGGLIYVDQDRGRVGALFALDDRTLVGGPSLGSGYPIELRIESAGGARRRRRPHQVVVAQIRGTTLGVRRHPYRAETVAFESGGAQLAGTLLLPDRPGPHPAVVMIHGSGPVDPRRVVAVGRHVRPGRHRRADPRQAGHRAPRPGQLVGGDLRRPRRRRPRRRCGCCGRGRRSTPAGSASTA